MGRISTTAALTIAGVLAAGTATALVNAHILASGLDGPTPTNPVELATSGLVEAPPLASPTPPLTTAPVTDATTSSSPVSAPPTTAEVAIDPPSGDEPDVTDAPVASDTAPADGDAGLDTGTRGGARPDRTDTTTGRPATTVTAPSSAPPTTTGPEPTTTAPRPSRPVTTTTTPRPTTIPSTTFPPDD